MAFPESFSGAASLAPTEPEIQEARRGDRAQADGKLDLRRLAWDLSLFTTSEFGFVELPPEFTTGSSIMPNKRNPDVVELMRATYATCAASRIEIEQLLSLPSGYQRDLQFSKGPLVRGFARRSNVLRVHRPVPQPALAPSACHKTAPTIIFTSAH